MTTSAESSAETKEPRTGSLWSRLSALFLLLFLVSAVSWVFIAGEAGSPLPDNWKQLLFWSHVSEVSALAALVASVISAAVSFRREQKVSVSGIVSLVLLIISLPILIKLFANNNF